MKAEELKTKDPEVTMEETVKAYYSQTAMGILRSYAPSVALGACTAFSIVEAYLAVELSKLEKGGDDECN